MWAMLLSMVTVSALMVFVVIERVIATVAICIVAHRQKMTASCWAWAGLMFGFFAILPYVYAKIKISKNKCRVCGTAASRIFDYCENCGERTERINEGKIVLKFILIYYAVCCVIYAFESILPGIMN